MTITAVRPARPRDALPLLLADVVVARVEQPSASFVRVELAGDDLADLGIGGPDDGPLLDQRIKLVVPGPSGRLPDVDALAAAGDWYAAWRALPEDDRGHLRTYTVRDVLGGVAGDGTTPRLVVDFVLHLDPGCTGPAAAWAASADVGDRLVVVAPRRGQSFGGVEFAPGDATDLLLVGDETALPALARILEDLPADAVGHAFVEVPVAEDVVDLRRPTGVALTWLVRGGGEPGARLLPAVVAHCAGEDPLAAAGDAGADDEVDPDLWETPAGVPGPGLYAWVAGEAGTVTALRRHLVRDLGLDRRQVAFMGYWRRGVAGR